MQSGSTVDSLEQRRLRQLMNVTNTWWEGKTQTPNIQTYYRDKEDDNLHVTAQQMKFCHALKHSIFISFVYSRPTNIHYFTTWTSAYLLLYRLHIRYFLMSAFSIENKLH